MVMSAPRRLSAIMASQTHRRCGRHRRIERELHSELDRGARCRNPGAYADQSAQAPERRPARHHAWPGLSCLRRYRTRLHRRGRGTLVRVARIRLRAACAGRRRADAHARLLPSLSPSLHEPAVALAETLLKIAPVPMARVVFQCSGSEANDTAVKLAWYYWNAVGQPQRKKIIARRMGYHGNTCAAVSPSGKPDMHAGFGLPFAPFLHTEFPHYYRRH